MTPIPSPDKPYTQVQIVYREMFRMFAHALRATPTTTPAQQERFAALTAFCDWVADHECLPGDTLVINGAWRDYNDVVAMVEYLKAPRKFRERHKSAYEAFLGRLSKEAV